MGINIFIIVMQIIAWWTIVVRMQHVFFSTRSVIIYFTPGRWIPEAVFREFPTKTLRKLPVSGRNRPFPAVRLWPGTYTLSFSWSKTIENVERFVEQSDDSLMFWWSRLCVQPYFYNNTLVHPQQENKFELNIWKEKYLEKNTKAIHDHMFIYVFSYLFLLFFIRFYSSHMIW